MANFGPPLRGRPYSHDVNHFVIQFWSEAQQEPRSEIGSLSTAEGWVRFQPGPFWFYRNAITQEATLNRHCRMPPQFFNAARGERWWILLKTQGITLILISVMNVSRGCQVWNVVEMNLPRLERWTETFRWNTYSRIENLKVGLSKVRVEGEELRFWGIKWFLINIMNGGSALNLFPVISTLSCVAVPGYKKQLKSSKDSHR